MKPPWVRPTPFTFTGFGVVLALAAWMSGAKADFFDTGNQLLTICQDQGNAAGGFCMGAAVGYYDAITLTHTCNSSDGSNKRQVRDVLLKYITDHPAERNRSATLLAVRAFRDAFGCKPKGKPPGM